ncbi:MAG: hypothetical protein JSV09_04725, partial [Thermoplasmata archaeon]
WAAPTAQNHPAQSHHRSTGIREGDRKAYSLCIYFVWGGICWARDKKPSLAKLISTLTFEFPKYKEKRMEEWGYSY